MDIYKYNMYYAKVLSSEPRGGGIKTKKSASRTQSAPASRCSGKRENSRHVPGNREKSGCLGRRQDSNTSSTMGSPASSHGSSTSSSSVSGKRRGPLLQNMFRFLTSRTGPHHRTTSEHSDFVTVNPIHEGVVLQ